VSGKIEHLLGQLQLWDAFEVLGLITNFVRVAQRQAQQAAVPWFERDDVLPACQHKNPKHYAQSDSPQIVGSDITHGDEPGGRKAMENILQKASEINLKYAINEPSAYGGYNALKAAGKEKGVLVVAVDGGCPGVKMVKEGIIGATSQQYPLLMASKGVEAVAEFIKTGKKPESLDTGEQLVTDHPVPGIPSINTDEGMKLCWG